MIHRRSSVGLLFGGICLLSLPAFAQPNSAPSTGNATRCKDPASTPVLIECINDKIHEADADLSKEYSKILNLAMIKGDPSAKAKLEKSQAGWESYMRQTCEDLVDELWKGGHYKNSKYTGL